MGIFIEEVNHGADETICLCACQHTGDKDTGNTKVQVAITTERIKQLTAHCKMFPKDAGAKRALTKLVGQRRSLLKYLQRKDLELYRALIKELGLRK